MIPLLAVVEVAVALADGRGPLPHLPLPLRRSTPGTSFSPGHHRRDRPTSHHHIPPVHDIIALSGGVGLAEVLVRLNMIVFRSPITK